MAAQQAALLSLIAGMKAARDRVDDASDSDEFVGQPTNRGNKLKRKARWVYEGQLDLPTGPKAYKRTIEHGGFRREIVFANPPRLDADGEELDEDEEDPENDLMGVSDVNPYADIRLEVLLGPLASLSDLSTHPSLSLPYHSTALPDLIQQVAQMVTSEQQKLLRAKNLLERFLGEDIWIPCGDVEDNLDDQVFGSEITATASQNRSKSPVDMTVVTTNGETTEEKLTNGVTVEEPAKPHTNGFSGEAHDESKETAVEETVQAEGYTVPAAEAVQDETGTEAGVDGDTASQDTTKDQDQPETAPARRMTTRAQTQASTQGDSSKDDYDGNSHARTLSNGSTLQFPHPLFLVPPKSRPDRDWSLPFVEAEDTRRLLLMLVQKREDSTKGLIRLRDGLLHANKLRQQVLRWSKAEAHVGEMSDNEDWYDKDEWGLEADLKKGREEDEEDPAAQRKPTRTRRN